MASPLLDALIIGGGPAGLSLANHLGRQLFNAVIFDSGVYRNAPATHMHNVLGFDHQNPENLRSKAREDLKRYETIRVERTAVESVRKTEDGAFEATDANGKTWKGKKLALATGVKDISPGIAGYEDCWGRGIFHCLFCHGFEERGQKSAGVLATGVSATAMMGPHLAHMVLRLAERAVIYTNGSEETEKTMKEALAEDRHYNEGRVTLDTRPITKFRMGTASPSSVVLSFEDGSEVEQGFVVNAPFTKPNGPFAEQLGLKTTDAGDIETNAPFFETSEPGVFAVGDCGSMIKTAAIAAYYGAMAAPGIGMQIASAEAAM